MSMEHSIIPRCTHIIAIALSAAQEWSAKSYSKCSAVPYYLFQCELVLSQRNQLVLYPSSFLLLALM